MNPIGTTRLLEAMPYTEVLPHTGVAKLKRVDLLIQQGKKLLG